MSRRPVRVLAVVLLSCGVVWAAFTGLAWRAMAAGPAAIERFMAPLPGPAFALLPFESLWNRARAGVLAPGDEAPDFELPLADGSGTLRLSSLRGRPVVLVFGSWT